jgi:uncharacterized protein YjiS (DUF1127 family)
MAWVPATSDRSLDMSASETTFVYVDKSPFILKLFSRIADAYVRYRQYRQMMADIAALRGMSDRDLKDIGVYRCDIDRAARQGHPVVWP